MSDQRASDRAAAQVEQIVAAAQQAADGIRAEAEAVEEEARRRGEQDAQRLRDEVAREVAKSRKEAVLLGQDARTEAETLVGEAKEEAARVRAETQAAVDGRVAAAERAAAEVLEEARALSGGLRQLGRALEEQAERILRDVQAAHRRMQADLRVGPEDRAPSSAPADEPVDRDRPARRRRSQTRAGEAGGQRQNPFEELDVPSWVGRDG